MKALSSSSCRVNIYRLILASIQPTHEDWLTWESLRPIAAAIRKSRQRVEKLTGDCIEDEIIPELLLVENLLGTAFVISQVSINQVVSSVKQLHARFENQKRPSFPVADKSRLGILRIGADKPKNCSYTRVELIDAAANYFKHGSEWRGPWEDLKNMQKTTAVIISAGGASRKSRDNLTKISEFLGKDSHQNVLLLAEILEKWRTTVHDTYQETLKTTKLI